MDMFCGAGGSSIGVTQAGATVRLAMNHWPVAIATHQANFPDVDHACKKVEAERPNHYPTTDVLIASPECFPAGTLILTATGLRPIEDVQVGDQVLTHQGRWRPVTATMRRQSDTIVVAGTGHPGLETTADHPVWARAAHRAGLRGDVRQGRILDPAPIWTRAADLAHGEWFWATPSTFGDALPVPPVGGRGVEFRPEFWWLVGRWLGDGLVRLRDHQPSSGRRDHRPYRPAPAPCVECGQPARRHARYPHLATLWCGPTCKAKEENARALTHAKGSEVQIVCGKHEADELAELLAYALPVGPRAQGGELRWRRRDQRTGVVFSCGHNGLVAWLVEHFGRYAHGKRLPAWALTMPAAWRQALLDGYVSADGHVDRQTRVSTASRELAVGVRLLAGSLGYAAGLQCKQRAAGTIEGRLVTVRPIWTVGWTPTPARQHTVADGRHRWAPVRRVLPGRGDVEVYNLSVAEDESYVADGIVVHNCDAHTYAGGKKRSRQQEPLFELSDEDRRKREDEARSRATMFDVPRWAEYHDYPVVIIENVLEIFDWVLIEPWFSMMRNLGYRWQVCSFNSMLFGPVAGRRAPQSRDRVYIVFTKQGNPKPDLNFQPRAWCPRCDRDVDGLQVFKRPDRFHGRYRQSWLIRHAEGCGTEALPYVAPAGSIIDWGLPCPPIGGRKKRLAASTIARIRAYLERHYFDPGLVTVTHTTRNGRVEVAGHIPRSVCEPTRAQTAQPEQALFEPFIDTARRNATGRDARLPLTAVAAEGNHHALVEPGVAPFIDTARINNMPRGVDVPLSTLSSGNNHYLVFPERGYVVANYDPGWLRDADGLPIGAITGRDSHGLLVQVAGNTHQRPGATHRVRSTGEPMRTQLGTLQEALVVPSGGSWRTDARPASQPLRTVMPTDTEGLVRIPPDFLVPYDRTNKARHHTEPMGTLTSHDRYGLASPDGDADPGFSAAELDAFIDACGYRMLVPAEIGGAMAFPETYQVTGVRDDQVAQYGNAVTPPVMAWIFAQVAESLSRPR